ncbi:hypothetical protein BOTNAR_0311g00010 [Botryotinia narcissicola]|uniref:Uncharacterized protein n=1 Tax=Botryotinia narcissicola TaxID=278944 RepID=A0A4Z1I0C3_9HELO|nr:hypothetical protein BOTNAR_0311g00010 [Botryotinia narcissicola]
MHNGLSSALLLGLLGGTARDAEVRDLQGNILEIFSESQDGTAGSNLETNSELSPPHARFNFALRRLYTDHESNTLHTEGHAAPENVNVGRFTNVTTGAWISEPPCPRKESNFNINDMATFQPARSEGQISHFSIDTFDSIIWCEY